MQPENFLAKISKILIPYNVENPIAVDSSYQQAAVLLPIIQHEKDFTVLFTQRTALLTHHAGQICFPGGVLEINESSYLDAALRETEEEIGIAPQTIQLLGQLPRYSTGTGYQITPFVGVIKSPFQLKLNYDEVELTFEAPLTYLLDEKNYSLLQRFYNIQYQTYTIWGATARIIYEMSQRMMRLNQI